MTKWLAEWLRRVADRIDYAGAPKAMSWSFTFEEGEGIRFRQDGRGCRLWYRGNSDYDRAWSENGPRPASAPLADPRLEHQVERHPGDRTFRRVVL